MMRFSADHTLVLSVRPGGQIEDIAVDAADGSCWVGLKERAVRLAADGSVATQISLKKGDILTALAPDPAEAALWVGTRSAIIRFDRHGQEQLRIEGVRDVVDLRVRNIDGTLWTATKRMVLRHDRTGALLSSIDPCPGGKDDNDRKKTFDCGKDHGRADDDEDREHESSACRSNIVALALDQTDGSAYAAWNRKIVRIGQDGGLLRWYRDLNQIRALDIGVPGLTVSISDPVDGAVVRDATTSVKGVVSDGTAKVTVNGREADMSGMTFEALEVPLSSGVNTITAAAVNIARLKASDSIQVTRQLDLPPLTIAIDAPRNGDVLTSSRVDVSGPISDPSAVIVVNGVQASIAGGTFTASGVVISPGGNLLAASAVDANGRTATDSVSVTFPWIDLSLQYPIDWETQYQELTNASGYVNDPQATVFVNGLPAWVMDDGYFWSPELRLREGWNEVTAQAVNRWGQVDTETARVRLQKSTNSPLEVSVIAPSDGVLISSPTFTVFGTVSDQDAEVIVNNRPADVKDGFFKAAVYACTWEEMAPDSNQCFITISAYSRNGSSVEQTLTYRYDPLADPISVQVTDPYHGAAVTASPLMVTGVVHDQLADIMPTTVVVNGVAAEVNNGVFTAVVPLEDGKNTITVSARDLTDHEAFDGLQVVYEPPQKPLLVSVTAPVQNATVNTPDVLVSGIMNDSTAAVTVNGIIARRDFRSFRAAGTMLMPGANTISVIATRPNGELAEASVIVTYDPAYPSPPAPQLSLLPGYSRSHILEITGLAGPLQTVELFVNGAGEGVCRADEKGLFSCSVQLPEEGPNHIAARALDAFGNRSALSEGRIVMRDTLAPPLSQVALDIKYLNLVVSRTFLIGQTEPFAELTVEVDFDPDSLVRATADSRGEFSVYLPMSVGRHVINLIASDKAGNRATSMRMHAVFDQSLSVFYGTSPVAPQLDPLPTPVNEAFITVEGNAYARFDVEIYCNDELQGTVRTDSKGRFRLDGVTLVPGVNRLRVRQKADQLDLGSYYFFMKAVDSKEVIVDLVAGQPVRPVPAFDFPLEGSVTNAGHLSLRGTVSGGAAYVRLNGGYASSDGYGKVADGRFVSNSAVPLLPGWNTLWVEAPAEDGSRGVSKIRVRYQRDAAVPSVKITEPIDSSEIHDFTVPVTGTAEDVARIVVNESAVDASGGSFTATVDLLNWPYGSRPDEYRNVVTAWAMDGAGRIGHDEVRLPYRYVPIPVISLTNHANNQVLNEPQVMITGTVSNAIGVTVNGRSAIIDNGAFSLDVSLVSGINHFNIIAKNGPRASAQTLVLYYYPASQVTFQSLSISPGQGVVPMGGTMKFSAVMTYSNGQTADLSGVSSWSIDDPFYAEIFDGSVRALKFGRAVVTARYGSFTATAQLSITDPALKSLEMAYEKDAIDGKSYYVFDDPTIYLEDIGQMRVIGFYTMGDRFDDLTNLAQWSSSDPAVAVIDNRGKVTPVKLGRTTITASLNGLSVSRVLTVAPPPVQLFITSPSPGTALESDSAIVRGWVLTQAPEVGVLVNGALAAVTGSEFVANAVPVGPDGMITAEATNSLGGTAKAQVAVSFSPVAAMNPLRIAASIESGTGPLETMLRIDGVPEGISPSIGFSGPGNVEFLDCTDPTACAVRLTGEGIYTFTVTSPGYDGNTYSAKIAITVLDRAKLEALLRVKWGKMTTAVLTGDVKTALNDFAENSKSRYQQILSYLSSNNFAETVLSSIGDIIISTVNSSIIECWALRQETDGTHAYPVTFVKDRHGLWKIMGF